MDSTTELVELSTSIEESNQIWCPTHRVGNLCPDETFLSFYKCCGHLNKDCCFHLRVWIVIMVIALPLFLILPGATIIIRKLCFSTDSNQQRRPMITNDSMPRRDSDSLVML